MVNLQALKHGLLRLWRTKAGYGAWRLASAQENKYHSHLSSQGAILFSTSLPYVHISSSETPLSLSLSLSLHVFTQLFGTASSNNGCTAHLALFLHSLWFSSCCFVPLAGWCHFFCATRETKKYVTTFDKIWGPAEKALSKDGAHWYTGMRKPSCLLYPHPAWPTVAPWELLIYEQLFSSLLGDGNARSEVQSFC